MGGTGGFVRGKTKLETYKQFRSQVNRREIEESTGLFMDGTGGKSELYDSMEWDEGSGMGFVLPFR